jgi:hypothetical protein
MVAPPPAFLFKKLKKKEKRKTLYIKKQGWGAHPRQIKAPKHNPVENITIKTPLIHK